MAVGPQTLSLDETDYVGIGVKEEGGKRARECEEEEKKKPSGCLVHYSLAPKGP